jgi:uncharacterized membrane protein YdbT with pleckstrin-like domain
MNDVFTWPVGCAGQPQYSSSAHAAAGTPVASYVLACTCGGFVGASLLGLLGTGLRELLGISSGSLLAVAFPIVGVAAVCQLAGRVAPLPERHAQVPQRWLLWRRRSLTAVAFGLVIGAGALTYLWHATAWVLAVLVVAAPTWQSAAVVGAIYGAGRGLALAVTWTLDRCARRRPAWDAYGGSSSQVALTLAPVAVMTYATALLMV